MGPGARGVVAGCYRYGQNPLKGRLIAELVQSQMRMPREMLFQSWSRSTMTPALRGDGKGIYRVHIIGNSGELFYELSGTLLPNSIGCGKASVEDCQSGLTDWTSYW